MTTKAEIHIEGLKYARSYLEGRGINTELCKTGKITHLKIIGGERDGKNIAVGALQEHESYPMGKMPGMKYDYNIVITGLRYTIKKVYLMTDKEARILAANANTGPKNAGQVLQSALKIYRDATLE